MNEVTQNGVAVRKSIKGLRAFGRGLVWLGAGAAVAIPLLACQPQAGMEGGGRNGGGNAGGGGATAPVTTGPVAGGSSGPTTVAVPVEVIREKIVYVDKPVEAKDEILATVGEGPARQEIRFSDIKDPLFKGYGLTVMLNVVQLKLARAEAQRRGLTVTPDDVQAETELTLGQIAPDADKKEYPAVLAQLLQQQKLQRSDFDLVMEVNANLRKVARSIKMDELTEDRLREAYNVLYGETIRVKHIACSNVQEFGDVQKRVAAGEAFEEVARKYSRNAVTARLGGELPPFSRASTDVPEVFKEVAFSLKEGEVSQDPVQAEGFYHLIKVEKRVAPRAVKYEDVRESIKADIMNRAMDAAVKQFRKSLGEQARQSLKIEDKTLAEQWEEKVKAETPAPTTRKVSGK